MYQQSTQPMQQSPAQLLPSGKKQNSNGQQVQQQQSGTGLTSKPMDMKTPMPMDSAQRNREWLARGAATSGSGPAGKVSDGDAQHLLDGNGTVEGAEESLSSSGKKGGIAKRMAKAFGLPTHNTSGAIQNVATIPTVVFEAMDGGVQGKRLDLIEAVKIGRQISPKVPPAPGNGVFDSKVLSRQHAEIWSENGKAFIMDVGSSNGTFLNGERLSAEGVGSMPWALKNGDQLDFGVDIINVDNDTVLYKKVSLKVTIVGGDDSAKSLSGTAPSATKQKDVVQTSLTSSYMLDNILAILQDECRKANEKTTDLAKLGQQLTQAQTMLEKAKSANVVASSQGIAKEKEALLARVAQLESQLQSKSTATLTESGPQKKITLLEVQLASSDSEKKALAAEMKRLLAVVEAEKKAAEELRANLKAMEAGKSRVLEGIRRELDDRERALHARQAQLDTSAQQRDAEQRRAIEQRENELRQSFDQREKALQRDAELRTLELTAALAQKDKELAAALSKTVLKGQAPTPADKDSNTVSTKKTSRADGAQSTETARVLTKQPTASSTLFSLLFSLAIILGICAAVTVTLFPELFEQMPDYASFPVSIVQNYYAHARATAPTVIADAQEYLSQIFVGQ